MAYSAINQQLLPLDTLTHFHSFAPNIPAFFPVPHYELFWTYIKVADLNFVPRNNFTL
jgi:hypothetical protein